MILKFQFPLLVCMLLCCSTISAQKYGDSEGVVVVKEWKGIAFSSEKSLYENVSQSPELKRISAILEALESDIFDAEFNGTVFVAVDSSYNSLSEEELEALFADRTKLKEFFNYYIVPGRLDAFAIKKAIEKNGGVAKLKTLSAVNLNVKLENDALLLFDMQKNSARIIATDYYYNSGFFHIVDGLVFP